MALAENVSPAGDGGLQPEQWLALHGDYLFRMACLRLGNRASAEDAVQETLLAGLRAADRYDGRCGERAWLTGILRHKIVDRLRKSGREVPLPEGEDGQIQESFLYKAFGIAERSPANWPLDPREAFERAEFWGIFQSCLGRLRENLRRAFVLKELEGVATEDICKDLGLSANNLWVTLHRARADLRKCLEKKWKQGGEG